MKNHSQTFKILLFDTKRSLCVSIQSVNVIFVVILIKMGLQVISERDGFILDLCAPLLKAKANTTWTESNRITT